MKRLLFALIWLCTFTVYAKLPALIPREILFGNPERADPQITLRLLGERLLELAADPALASLGFTFTLGARHERRECFDYSRDQQQQLV